MDAKSGLCDALAKLDIKLPAAQAFKPKTILHNQYEPGVRSGLKKSFGMPAFKARAVPKSTYVRPAVSSRILSTKMAMANQK